MNKPVNPKAHGLIDYAFSGIQLAAPAALRLNSTAARTFGVLGAGFLALNALTDTPVGMKPALTFRQHKRADTAFLVGQAALTFLPFIRKHRKALTFHLAILAVAVTHYILTDYKSGSR